MKVVESEDFGRCFAELLAEVKAGGTILIAQDGIVFAKMRPITDEAGSSAERSESE